MTKKALRYGVLFLKYYILNFGNYFEIPPFAGILFRNQTDKWLPLKTECPEPVYSTNVDSRYLQYC